MATLNHQRPYPILWLSPHAVPFALSHSITVQASLMEGNKF
jgi:hypothetical protein